MCSDRGQPDSFTMLNRYLIKHKTPGEEFEEEGNTAEILMVSEPRHCTATAAQ